MALHGISAFDVKCWCKKEALKKVHFKSIIKCLKRVKIDK